MSPLNLLVIALADIEAARATLDTNLAMARIHYANALAKFKTASSDIERGTTGVTQDASPE